jgi:hypothetical protein
MSMQYGWPGGTGGAGFPRGVPTAEHREVTDQDDISGFVTINQGLSDNTAGKRTVVVIIPFAQVKVSSHALSPSSSEVASGTMLLADHTRRRSTS